MEGVCTRFHESIYLSPAIGSDGCFCIVGRYFHFLQRVERWRDIDERIEQFHVIYAVQRVSCSSPGHSVDARRDRCHGAGAGSRLRCASETRSNRPGNGLYQLRKDAAIQRKAGDILLTHYLTERRTRGVDERRHRSHFNRFLLSANLERGVDTG